MKIMEENRLYSSLEAYSKADVVPMHMPGHKRNVNECSMVNPYAFDITEIDGFDNLHHATGVIKDEQDRATALYKSAGSFFLVNGSSCGILAGITAMAANNRCKRKIIIARNCHRSVYNGVYINGLQPVFAVPKMDERLGIYQGLESSDFEECDWADVCGVVITSPSYEGIVSDVKGIVATAHDKGVPVMVDAAHGAHFYFHNEFPDSGLEYGADIVVESLHKTLPALTQTAILHVGRDSCIDCGWVGRFVSMYQSTSPSYVLLGSISRCMEYLTEKVDNFVYFVEKLKKLRKKIGKLNNIRLYPVDDISKLVLYSPKLKGRELYDILLEEYNIQPEMASLKYVIAMTSVCDSQENYDRLYEALRQIDASLEASDSVGVASDAVVEGTFYKSIPKPVLAVGAAYEAACEEVILEEACARVCADYVMAYPPGSPVIIPGELFDEATVCAIEAYREQGVEIIGLDNGKVRVVQEKNL